jgi:hypothetical protein
MVRNGGWYYLEGWLQRLVALYCSDEEWRLVPVLPGGLAAETGSFAVVRNGGWYYLGGWLQRLVVLQW